MRRCDERTSVGLFACPRCEGEVHESVSDGETTNFRCLACGACWHVELGYISRVAPGTCPGCEHRQQCLLNSAQLTT